MKIIQQQIVGQSADLAGAFYIESFDKDRIAWPYRSDCHPVPGFVYFHNPLQAGSDGATAEFGDHTNTHVLIQKDDWVFTATWNLWPTNASCSWHVSPSLSSGN